MSTPYEDLRAKVDAFARSVHARRAADMACRAGCDACCQVSLTVCAVEARAVLSAIEALPDELAQRLAERAAGRLAEVGSDDADPDADGPCVMLEDGKCVIYDSRPLVCRTQGLPLAYPPDFIPLDAVYGRDARGHELTWCPLNFEGAPPAPAEVLDAAHVDSMLAVIEELEGGGGARFSLESLVADALL